MNNLETIKVTPFVRPVKIVILLPYGADWISIFNRIIEIASLSWGGDNFIVVPYDQSGIKDTFLHIIYLYDPDMVYVYNRSFYDLQISNEAGFKEQVEKISEDLHTTVEEAEQILLDSPTRTHVPPDVKKQLYKVVSFLRVQGNREPIIHEIGYKHNEGYLLTKMLDVLKGRKFPLKHIYDLDVSSIKSEKIKLIIKSITGSANLFEANLSKYKGEFAKSFEKSREYLPIADRKYQEQQLKNLEEIEFRKISVGKNISMDLVMDMVIKQKIDLEHVKLIKDLSDQLKMPQTDEISNNIFTFLPFPLSKIGLAPMVKSYKFRYEEPIPYVITGDSAEDFCLWYNLCKMGVLCYFLPYSEILNARMNSKEIQILLSSIFKRIIFDFDKKIKITSLSLKKHEITSFIKKIVKISVFVKEVQIEKLFNLKDEDLVVQQLLEYPIETESFYQLYNNKSTTPMISPKPKTFNVYYAQDSDWIVEMDIEKSKRPPCIPDISAYNFLDPTLPLFARVSKNGISYYPKTPFISAGAHINDVITNPFLKSIDSLELTGKIFNSEKYKINFSDKGIYLKLLIEKFKNNIEECKEFFYLKSTKPYVPIKLMMSYVTEKSENDNRMGKGIYIDRIKRWFFTSYYINNFLTDKQIEFLTTEGVLKRGYIFKCNFCQSESWYLVQKVSTKYICDRCNRENQVTAHSLYRQAEIFPKDINTRIKFTLSHDPQVFYDLDEIVYNFFKHDGYVTLLALDNLIKKSKESFIWFPEVQFKSQSLNCEIDILAFSDGVVYIGEGKINAKLFNNADLDNMLVLTEHIYNRVIILAYLEGKFKPSFKQYLKQRLEKRSIKYLILKGKSLEN